MINSKKYTNVSKAILAIADGYHYKLVADGSRILLVVENPDFQEDNGSDVNLVFYTEDLI